MPFGKYAGTVLADLPISYLEWFQRQGMPKGKLGMQLSTIYEIKLNGLMDLLTPIRGEVNYEKPKKRVYKFQDMKNYFKIIFVIISGAIILLNIWFATNINGAYKYEVSVNNLDLILKNVWINYGLAKWILVTNSFYILFLTIFITINKKVPQEPIEFLAFFLHSVGMYCV